MPIAQSRLEDLLAASQQILSHHKSTLAALEQALASYSAGQFDATELLIQLSDLTLDSPTALAEPLALLMIEARLCKQSHNRNAWRRARSARGTCPHPT